MTLSDVASRAGVSVSLLSQIERGLTDPSLDSLRDIAEALGTAPFKLLAEQSHESRLVRAGEGRRLSLPDTDVEIELLSPSMEGPFEVIRWSLDVGGATARAPRSHEGVETTILLSGEVQIEAGDDVLTLHSGDAFTAKATIPHRTVNIGNEPAEAISVISPPNF
jgi:transcriptional regulator with XRE-family HTH domain